jgi:hypothetical protein
MSQIATLTAEERREVFIETGVRLGIPPFHVEKDYWVCWTLVALFNNNTVGPHLVFRGGTSLSKGWGLINRFSEDIDLSMNREWLSNDSEIDTSFADDSKSGRERRLKALRTECRRVVSEFIVPTLKDRYLKVAKDGDDRITVETIEKARDPFVIYFRYPESGLTPPSNYFQPRVKIELSGRADGVPVAIRTIEPYVTGVFPNLNPTGRQYEIPCIKPIRTFWEKVALLHELNTRPERSVPGSRQSRHLYDLHQLWFEGGLSQEVTSSDMLFKTVMTHRSHFFAYNWVDHLSLKPSQLVICPPEDELALWRNDYQQMESMFFREAPKFEQIVESMRAIEAHFR